LKEFKDKISIRSRLSENCNFKNVSSTWHDRVIFWHVPISVLYLLYGMYSNIIVIHRGLF